MRDGRVLAAPSRLIGVARQRNHLANAKAIRLAVWGSNVDARSVAKWEQTYTQSWWYSRRQSLTFSVTKLKQLTERSSIPLSIQVLCYLCSI